MSKLTLDALKERVNQITSEELLLSISGGTENACHDRKGRPSPPPEVRTHPADGTYVRKPRIKN